MIDELPAPTQERLWPVKKKLGDQSLWIRELLATHGTLTTTEIVSMVRSNPNLVSRKLSLMEQSLMIKPIAINGKGVKGRGEFRWALRCYPEPCVRKKGEGDVR